MSFFLECPACGKLNPVRFTRIDGELSGVCEVCGKPQPLPLTEDVILPVAAADSTPIRPANGPAAAACPKCGASRAPGQESCPKCGLVFVLWVAPPAPFSLHPELAGRWAGLREVPLADPRHDRFLEACFRAGALSDAACAYKSLAVGGAEDPSARIRQIQLLSQMQFTPSAPVDRRKYRMILWGLIFLMLLAALYIWTITPDDLFQ